MPETRGISLRSRDHVGVACGLAAYLAWGCIIFYFKAVEHVSPLEVLAHRIVWSSVLLLGILVVRRRLGDLQQVLRQRRTLVTLAASTLMIAVNWFVFIWAVTSDRVLDTSLGYFINPIVSVLLGFVFLRERLSRFQAIGVGFAAVGVSIAWWRLGQLPVAALTLAFTFGMYGLIRKRLEIDNVIGLTVETLLLAPAALGCLVWWQKTGELAFTNIDLGTDLLLPLSGVVTALPLLCFVAAARRLRLATVGMLQYVAPTCTFLFAVFIYHEPFDAIRLLSFVFIWVALVVYTVDSIRDARRHPAPTKGASDNGL